MSISAGKFWSLRRLADRRGLITLVALDEVAALGRLVQARHGRVEWAELARLTAMMAEAFAEHGSAVMVDPAVGYPAAAGLLDPARGLVVSLQTAEEDARTHLLDGWTAERARRLGADAVALRLPWRPDSPPDTRAHQQRLAEQLGRDCRTHDIGLLLLAPLPEGDEPDPDARAQMTVATALELGDERYGAELLGLPPPVSGARLPSPNEESEAAAAAQACFDRLDQALRCPWLVMSEGEATEGVRRAATYAARAGACGWVTGRPAWSDAVQDFPDSRVRQRLRNEGAAFLDRMRTVVESYGRAWTATPALAEGLSLRHAGPEFARIYGGGGREERLGSAQTRKGPRAL